MNKTEQIRNGVEIVNGQIIGDPDTRKRAKLYNVATGELIQDAYPFAFETDADARTWAETIIANRKSVWGYDYPARYPQGMELRIWG